MPIAVGEWGYAEGTVGSQTALAQVFVRQMLLAMALTGQPAMWYKACDGPGESGLRGNGVMVCPSSRNASIAFRPLPAFNASQVMYRILRNDGATSDNHTAWRAPVDQKKGFRFARRVPIWQQSAGTDDDWLFVYHSDDGGVLLVAWTTATFPHITRIPGVAPGSCFSQTGMMGEVLPQLCHDHRGLHVNVSAAPVSLVRQ
jgi:hypothetical protein